MLYLGYSKGKGNTVPNLERKVEKGVDKPVQMWYNNYSKRKELKPMAKNHKVNGYTYVGSYSRLVAENMRKYHNPDVNVILVAVPEKAFIAKMGVHLYRVYISN